MRRPLVPRADVAEPERGQTLHPPHPPRNQPRNERAEQKSRPRNRNQKTELPKLFLRHPHPRQMLLHHRHRQSAQPGPALADRPRRRRRRTRPRLSAAGDGQKLPLLPNSPTSPRRASCLSLQSKRSRNPGPAADSQCVRWLRTRALPPLRPIQPRRFLLRIPPERARAKHPPRKPLRNLPPRKRNPRRAPARDRGRNE